MSSKIEFCYLSDRPNQEILFSAISTLLNYNVTYNEYIPGEYSYRLHGPGGQLGESNTVTEKGSEICKTAEELAPILNLLAIKFSPTLTMGTGWHKNHHKWVISICESGNIWKKVKISIDGYEFFRSLNSFQRGRIADTLLEIFYKIAQNIEPYYGFAALDLNSIPVAPERLQIDAGSIGDFSYFSKDFMLQVDLSAFQKNHVVRELPDGTALLHKKEGVFNLI